MHLDGAQRGVRPRYLEIVESVLRAARHRNLRADDVDRTQAIARGGFGGPCEAGCALGRHLVGQRDGFARAAHAGVEVQLGEAGLRIGRDHHLGPAMASSGGRCFQGFGPR